MALTPYRVDLPTGEALAILTTALRGGSVDKWEAIHVIHDTAGYVLGQVQAQPVGPLVLGAAPEDGLTREECAVMLEQSQAVGTKGGKVSVGLPWGRLAKLLPVLMALLQELLAKE